MSKSHPSASEAASLYETTRLWAEEEQFRQILEHIRDAARTGDALIEDVKDIAPRVRSRLRELGYVVTSDESGRLWDVSFSHLVERPTEPPPSAPSSPPGSAN